MARRVVGALFAGVLVASSCGGRDRAREPDETKPTDESAADPADAGPRGIDLVAGVTERNTSPGADGKVVNAVVAGTNDFAVRFFQRAAGKPAKNVVVGNYSLSTALLLTMAGTQGSTTDGFAHLLGVGGIDREGLHPAVNAIDLILESRSRDGLDISTANKVFVQQGLALRDEFLDTAVGSYGAPVGTVDFLRAPDDAVAAVNSWVFDETNGLIEKLTDGYDPKTVVVLANAMYLKASWAVEFRRVEQPGRFRTIDGKVVRVDMMAHDEYLPLNQGKDFTAVELPYVGGNLSLVVIQPKNLVAFEADLTADRLRRITDGLDESGIHLTMPIWSTKTSIEALEPLHDLGLPHEYDFGAMFEGGESGYFIDSVSHVARVDVDETGTTAAAATDVAIAGSHGPTVDIDRPFFYLIRDRGSGAILFLGHVTNPAITD